MQVDGPNMQQQDSIKYVEILDMSNIPKVPERIGQHVISKSLKKSVVSSLMKNRSLNRNKRANLDAG